MGVKMNKIDLLERLNSAVVVSVAIAAQSLDDI